MTARVPAGTRTCTGDAYADGGYEIRTTQVAPRSERIVKGVMREMLAELGG